MTTESRYYGVSSGDGNNGVSQMFPDYIVKTDQPWRLAELAALTMFKPGEGHVWAKENMEIDGEADHTISVVFSESAETQEERQELYDKADKLDELADNELNDKRAEELIDQAIQLRDEAEQYGTDYTWLIVEIFPWTEDLPEKPWGRMVYESLEEAFGEDVKLVAA